MDFYLVGATRCLLGDMSYNRFPVFLLLGVFVLTSCRLPEDEIRQKMQSSVRIGSSQKDVIQFLEANSFDWIINPRKIEQPNDIEVEWMTASRKERILFRVAYTKLELFFDDKNKSLVEYRISTSYPSTSFLAP